MQLVGFKFSNQRLRVTVVVDWLDGLDVETGASFALVNFLFGSDTEEEGFKVAVLQGLLVGLVILKFQKKIK